MIIISGVLTLHPGQRDVFLALTREIISAARKAKGCRSFIVAEDPIEPNIAVVYEEWDTENDLLKFREKGPSPDMKGMITGANVQRHHISSSEPA